MSPADDKKETICTCGQILAIAAVPKQPWTAPSGLSLALERGTLFENLYFPFYAGGNPK